MLPILLAGLMVVLWICLLVALRPLWSHPPVDISRQRTVLIIWFGLSVPILSVVLAVVADPTRLESVPC